jgi:hypothetical protein
MGTYVDIASRRSGSIEVSLLWNRATGKLLVVAYDSVEDEQLTIPVDGKDATEVYRHPFAYADRAARSEPSRRRRVVIAG